MQTELERRLLAWVANIMRCYDRDNVPTRRVPRGVLVRVTYEAATEGRLLLLSPAEPQPDAVVIGEDGTPWTVQDVLEREG